MDTTQWPQGIGLVKAVEKKSRPHKEQALSCPRCSSANTKFCYYNNYSLTQPRYFCKTCRRYWTEGGCLRNVPVGGGSRKHRRPSSSPTASANPNPKIRQYGRQDLNLAHNASHCTANIGMSEYMALPFDPRNPNFINSAALPVMELFKGIGSGPVYGNGDSSSGFHGVKMSLGFPAEGYNGNLMKQQFDEMQGEEGVNGGFWNGMIAGGSSSW